MRLDSINKKYDTPLGFIYKHIDTLIEDNRDRLEQGIADPAFARGAIKAARDIMAYISQNEGRLFDLNEDEDED